MCDRTLSKWLLQFLQVKGNLCDAAKVFGENRSGLQCTSLAAKPWLSATTLQLMHNIK